MKSHPLQTAKLALLLLPILLSLGTKGAVAQITSAPDGTGTIVKQAGQSIDISGGTQVGGNQFHSFQQFGVNAGQTATFLSNPNSVNIVGRVTGGDPSFINGLLRVTGSHANLYLMNPAGIVFGKGASLNVPAAFTATTANSIGFGNGQWFNAFGSNNYSALTGNPNRFGFVGASGSLINAGNLSVNSGQQISLIGGTVINTGTIEAPGGTITVAAVPGEKLVRIGQAGTVLSLDLPTSDRTLINAPNATPLSLPELLTGGTIPPAMGVVVEDGVVKLTGGSAAISGTLSADGVGAQNGGNVVAYADNHLNFAGTIGAKGGELGGNGGFVETSGKGTIEIDPNAKVVTTALKGEMGTWTIDPADLEVIADGGSGSISGASTFEVGALVAALDGTNVELVADNSITVNAAIDASGNASAGDLSLNAPTANLNQAINLLGNLSGTATTVNVGANGTVQNGVDVAAAGGTVNLAAATYTLGNTVYIEKDVTVRGAGSESTKVSGNNEVQVFRVLSGHTVTLDSMAIVEGYNFVGGGIMNSGTLTVSNSILSDNFAQFNGGAITNAGHGTVTLNNSTLRGNTAGSGGGIMNFGTLTLNNSILSSNTADSGGGIYNSGNGTLTLNNSTLSENSAADSGGGIYNAHGTLTLNNSILSGNIANYGGGIYNDDTLTLNDSTLSTNFATYGGGIYNAKAGGLTLNNSTLSENSTEGEGGESGGSGIANYGTSTVSNSILSGNSTNGYGGGIMNYGDLTLNDSTLSENSTSQVGGGIFNSGTLTVSHSTLSENSATYYGGGIFNLGTATFSNSTLSGNSASQVGGGIFNGGTLTVSDSILSDNSATYYGGGIFNGGDLTVSNSTLSGNSALYSGEGGEGEGLGGGIFNFGTATVSNSTLSGNSATYGGGGIFNGGSLTVSNSTLSGNSATYYGGGIFNGGTLTVSNSTLSGNSATYGGGISSSNHFSRNNSSVEIGNSIVAGNTASTGREIYMDIESGPFTSNGYNLFGYSGDSGLSGVETASTDLTPTVALNKIIAPLGNYGGPTQTYALVPGSAAIDAGDPTIAEADQRGVAPVGTRDIGAYESKGFALIASNSNQSTTVNTAFANPLTVNLVETAFSSSLPIPGIEIQLSVPSSGASATLDKLTGVTDSTGAFTFYAMANTEVGTYTVQATSPGVAGANFSLTNTEVVKAIEPPVQNSPEQNSPEQSPPEQKPIVLPFNLEAQNTSNASPSTQPTTSVLCVAREGTQEQSATDPSTTDPYKGVPTCGTPSSK